MYYLSPKCPLNEWFDDRFYMKLWILCITGRDISIRFAESIWQRRATPDAIAGPPVTVLREKCSRWNTSSLIRHLDLCKTWNIVWHYRIRCFWPPKRHRQADFADRLHMGIMASARKWNSVFLRRGMQHTRNPTRDMQNTNAFLTWGFSYIE